jgi:hypothetical protein
MLHSGTRPRNHLKQTKIRHSQKTQSNASLLISIFQNAAIYGSRNSQIGLYRPYIQKDDINISGLA